MQKFNIFKLMLPIPIILGIKITNYKKINREQIRFNEKIR